MKSTDTNIAKYYGVTTKTLRNYKNGKIEKQRLYRAMVKVFLEEVVNKKDDEFFNKIV